MARKIVIAELKACRQAKAYLSEVYGDEIEVTEENLEKLPPHMYVEVAGYIRHLLSGAGLAEYIRRMDSRPTAHNSYPCLDCKANIRIFIDIYNRETPNAEGLFELRERPQPPEPQAV